MKIMFIIISCRSTVDFREETVWLSIIASCTFYAVGDVMFTSAGSRVDEGDDTSGVCLELNGGNASALGCELTINLTTVTGKAGMLMTQYSSIVYVWSVMGVLHFYYTHTVVYTTYVCFLLYLLVCVPFLLFTLYSISDENDFTHRTYTEVFTVGTTFPDTQCIDISTTEDDFLEGDHEFIVSIVSTTLNDAVTISSPSTHVATIDDNDGENIIMKIYITFEGRAWEQLVLFRLLPFHTTFYFKPCACNIIIIRRY